MENASIGQVSSLAVLRVCLGAVAGSSSGEVGLAATNSIADHWSTEFELLLKAGWGRLADPPSREAADSLTALADALLDSMKRQPTSGELPMADPWIGRAVSLAANATAREFVVQAADPSFRKALLEVLARSERDANTTGLGIERRQAEVTGAEVVRAVFEPGVFAERLREPFNSYFREALGRFAGSTGFGAVVAESLFERFAANLRGLLAEFLLRDRDFSLRLRTSVAAAEAFLAESNGTSGVTGYSASPSLNAALQFLYLSEKKKRWVLAELERVAARLDRIDSAVASPLSGADRLEGPVREVLEILRKGLALDDPRRGPLETTTRRSADGIGSAPVQNWEVADRKGIDAADSEGWFAAVDSWVSSNYAGSLGPDTAERAGHLVSVCVDDSLEPWQVRRALDALADFYRDCGGDGFELVDVPGEAGGRETAG